MLEDFPQDLGVGGRPDTDGIVLASTGGRHDDLIDGLARLDDELLVGGGLNLHLKADLRGRLEVDDRIEAVDLEVEVELTAVLVELADQGSFGVDELNVFAGGPAVELPQAGLGNGEL